MIVVVVVVGSIRSSSCGLRSCGVVAKVVIRLSRT